MRKHLLFAACVVLSGSVRAADFAAPCTVDCSTEEAFSLWTVIDENEATSPNTWTFNSGEGAAVYTSDKSSDANDWLISPAITMKAGVSYDVTAYMKGSGTAWYYESFEILVGNSTETGALTTKLYSLDSKFMSSWWTYWGGKSNNASTFTPDADGDYYVAIHCYSEFYNGDVYVQNIKIDAIVAYPGRATDVSAKAAPDGEMKAEISWTMPDVTDLGGALGAVSGAKIYRGTTSSFTISESALVGTFEGGRPGEVCTWTDATVSSAGQYYYAVVPFDDNGDSTISPTRVQSDWIGFDTSVSSISEVVASLVDGSETAVKITWTAPAGSHGAPIEPGSLKYKIVRSGVTTKEVTLESEFDGTEYTDETIEGLDNYTYTVTTVFNGSTAWLGGTKSNSVLAGGALTPPYSEDFNSNNALALWTLFHGENGTRDWGISNNALDFWGGSFADAWAVMPVMNLKANTPYEISFTTWLYTKNSPKDLYVYIGDEPTAESLEKKQLFFETVESTTSTAKRIVVSVPEDGRYYFAFRCYGNSDSWDIYVDNLVIKEIETIPDVVTDLQASVGENGAMEVTLTWTNPTQTNAGTELAEITKAEVLRNNSVVATLPAEQTRALTELIPGEVASYTDTSVPAAGKYTYGLRLYINDNVSETATVETEWVGPDIPSAPAVVSAVMEEDGSRTITFDYVTDGANGGYVGDVHYEVSRNGTVIDNNVTESPFIDSQELEYGKYTYGVKAVNGNVAGTETFSEGIMFGGALQLPYKPNFNDADDMAKWTLTGDNKTWEYKNGYLEAGFSAADSWAFTPPLYILHSKVEVSLRGRCYNYWYPEKIEIYLSKSTDHTNDAHHSIVATAEISSATDNYITPVEFYVPAEGVYHIGYHRVTEDPWTAMISDTSLVMVVNMTGVESVSSERTDRICYSAVFNRIEASEGAVVEIFDTAGRHLFGERTASGFVSTAALPSGVYVAVAVAPDGGRQTLKFVK